MKNNKKISLLLFTLIFSLLLAFFPNSKANADAVSDENSSSANTLLYSKKISDYVIETVYTPSNTMLTDSLYQTNTIVQFDFTGADFFDEAGNIVDKDEVMKTIVPASPEASTYGASTSGGSWSHGTGYAVCKGMTVKGNSGLIGLQVSYKVDFQNVQYGFDQLNRVYSATIDGIGSWSWLSNGVFRQTETGTYSAYGGIKGQWAVSLPGYPVGTSTKHLYFRVGNDTFGLDHNL